MAKSRMWGIVSKDDRPINVVLFISRNKDNGSVEGFKERRMSFITKEPIESDILRGQFELFKTRGLPGEVCRMYYSVNDRDSQKIYTELLHYLIDNPDFNLAAIDSKLASIAAKKECRNTKSKKWLFDFDIDDPIKLSEFIHDIGEIASSVKTTWYPTPHGYAVITEKGFDTRTLLEKWGEDISLKRDDLLLVKWFDEVGDLYDGYVNSSIFNGER